MIKKIKHTIMKKKKKKEKLTSVCSMIGRQCESNSDESLTAGGMLAGWTDQSTEGVLFFYRLIKSAGDCRLIGSGCIS